MQTQLAPQEAFTGFSLKSLLDSQISEEIILAILSNFNRQKSVEVIRQILHKLQGIGTDKITLRKYILQLTVLACLRNLTKETHKQIQDIGLTYNITEDYLYQEGRKQEKEELIIKMLKDKTLSIEKIAQILDVTVDYVKRVEKELTK